MSDFFDLDRFRDTYFDECAEMLQVVETGLNDLTAGTQTAETINAVFRAVHSIKGGGGSFGLDELVRFAHEFEAVLDLLRSRRLTVSRPLIELMLRSTDVLTRLLELARAREPVPVGLGVALRDALLAVQQGRDPAQLTGSGGAGAGEVVAPAVPAAPPLAPDDVVTSQRFHINFVPHPDLLLTGNEPLYLFRALSHLGTLSVRCHTDCLPSLDGLDPEQLRLSWSLVLDTLQNESAVREIFDFVADDCDLTITLEPGPPVADSPQNATIPADILTAASVDSVESVGPDTVVDAQFTSLVPSSGMDVSIADSAVQPAVPTDSGRQAGSGQSIRIDLDRLDRLVNLVGEMVIVQAMVVERAAQLPSGTAPKLIEGLEELTRHTRDLQDSVMAARAQPVRSVFVRMPRLVRDLAADLGKDVQLATAGETTEVDKTVIESLVDPLTHMIRNAVDHGVEPPAERERLGKPRTGTILLSAAHRSGRIVIEVVDDGRGIDRERVLAKARQQGLVAPDARLSAEEIDQLIFMPGFSTAESVSAVSGRGVGMDVVRGNVMALGGRITVHNTPGKGTRFVLSLPLTLAVMDGMVLRIADQRFVLPLTNIIESLRPLPGDLHRLAGRDQVILARGRYVRLLPLHQVFRIPGAVEDPTEGLVVLAETEEGGTVGLIVDDVIGQQQVVVKSLDTHYGHVAGIAAATILGDGRVALILDVAGLQGIGRIRSAQTRTAEARAAETRTGDDRRVFDRVE